MGSTTKFGWPYPDPSDLVRDAPEAFEDLADAIEATLGGTILQVVQTAKTDVFSTTSTSFTDVTGLSASITPTSASNKVLVITDLGTGTGNDVRVWSKLLRGSTDIYIGDASGVTIRGFHLGYGDDASGKTGTRSVIRAHGTFLDSPNTTSATTYKVQMRTDGGTGYLNRTFSDNLRTASSITLIEVGA